MSDNAVIVEKCLGEDEIHAFLYLCPSCDCDYLMAFFNYCPNCGAKLVFSKNSAVDIAWYEIDDR